MITRCDCSDFQCLAVCEVAWRVRVTKEGNKERVLHTPIEDCKIREERIQELCKAQSQDCRATGDGFHIWV